MKDTDATPKSQGQEDAEKILALTLALKRIAGFARSQRARAALCQIVGDTHKAFSDAAVGAAVLSRKRREAYRIAAMRLAAAFASQRARVLAGAPDPWCQRKSQALFLRSYRIRGRVGPGSFLAPL